MTIGTYRPDARCPRCGKLLKKTEWAWIGDCPGRHGFCFYDDALYQQTQKKLDNY